MIFCVFFYLYLFSCKKSVFFKPVLKDLSEDMTTRVKGENVFVLSLDVSISIGDDLPHLKSSAGYIVNALPKSTIISFGSLSQIDCEDCESKKSFDAVMGLGIRGSTNMRDSLTQAGDVFNRRCVSRDCRKTLFLITDGYPNNNIETKKRVQELKNSGVTVYAIGVGSLSKSFLLSLASSEDTYIIEESLLDLENRVKSELEDLEDFYISRKPSIVDVDLHLYPSNDISKPLSCKVIVTHRDGPALPADEVFLLKDNNRFFKEFSFIVDVELDRIGHMKGVDGKRDKFEKDFKECLEPYPSSSVYHQLMSIPKVLEVIPESKYVVNRYKEYKFDVAAFEDVLYQVFEVKLKNRGEMVVLCVGPSGVGKSEDYNALVTFCSDSVVHPLDTGGSFEHRTKLVEMRTVSTLAATSDFCPNLFFVDMFGLTNIRQENLSSIVNGKLPLLTHKDSYDEATGIISEPPLDDGSQYNVDIIWWYIPASDLLDPALQEKYKMLKEANNKIPILPIIECHSTTFCGEDVMLSAQQKLSFMANVDSKYAHTAYPYVYDAKYLTDKDTLRSSHYFMRLTMSYMHREEKGRNQPEAEPSIDVFKNAMDLMGVFEIGVLFVVLIGFFLFIFTKKKENNNQQGPLPRIEEEGEGEVEEDTEKESTQKVARKRVVKVEAKKVEPGNHAVPDGKTKKLKNRKVQEEEEENSGGFVKKEEDGKVEQEEEGFETAEEDGGKLGEETVMEE